jgi:hypothetical protein
MTHDEIDRMEAGDAIDLLVAQRLFGWRRIDEDDEQPEAVPYYVGPNGEAFYPTVRAKFPNLPRTGRHELPPFSSDISAAWQVVEKTKERGWLVHILQCTDGFVVNAREYHLPADGDWGKSMLASGLVQVEADTAQLAICRAALRAVAPPPASGEGAR